VLQSVECILECKVFFLNVWFRSIFLNSSKFDKLVTRRLLSVAPTRWLHTQRLVEIVSQLKTELINFFKSVMNNKNEWDGETRNSARGYHDILKHFNFSFYLKVLSGALP
jgi:hypothetical protein